MNLDFEINIPGNGSSTPAAFERSEWIGRCERRLRTTRPLMSAAAVVSYALAAIRGLGHQSPEETADQLAACLPTGSAPAPRSDG